MGLGRYTRNLVAGLSRNCPADEITLFVPRRHAHFAAGFPNVRTVEVHPSYYSLREQWGLFWQLRKNPVDIMHFPHFNAPILYGHFGSPFVITVHDLTRFMFPAQKNKNPLHQTAYEAVFAAAVNRSAGIIAVSEHTRRDLLRFFPKSESKTKTIYQGIDKAVFRPGRDAADLKIRQMVPAAPFALFVGVWMDHKNIKRLLFAFREFLKERPGWKLVITGRGRPHDVNVPKEAEALGIERQTVFPGIVADELMPALYRQAEMLVLPSLYEGFGFPALEAAACGTAVVAANNSAMPETMPDAAYFADPYSVDDILRKMLDASVPGEKREEKIRAGIAAAAAFSWEECLRTTRDFYAAAGAKKA